MNKIDKYLINEYTKKNSKFPELDKVAAKIATNIGKIINKETKSIKSEMPYKAQYVLEEVIEHLKESV